MDLYGTWTGTSWSADAEDLSDRPPILEWLDAELPNLVRLVRAAADGDADERLTAVQLALGMPRIARGLMRFAEAYEAISALVTLEVDLDIRLDHGRLYQMSAAAASLGLFAEALPWSTLELPLARAIGDPTQLSASLVGRSSCLSELGQAAESLLVAEQALSIIGESGALTHEAGANLAVGIAAGKLGDVARQQVVFHRAIELLSRAAPTSAALGWHMIGSSLRESGQYKASLVALNDALQRSRDAKIAMVEVGTLTEIGTAWLAIGDHAKARQALTEGVAIAERHPEEHREALPRHRLGQALAGLGMVAQARAEWKKAIVLYDRMADPRAAEVRKLLGREGERGGGPA